MLTIQQLEILIAIEQTGSLRKAADMLFLSQPALSVSIKKMEEALGTQLFVRKSTGIELMPISKQILPIAKEVLVQMRKLESVCSEFTLLNKTILPDTVITLKAYPLISKMIFPKIIIPLKEYLQHVNFCTKNIPMEDGLTIKNDNEIILYIEPVEEDELENHCSRTVDGANNCRICSIYPCINMHKEYFPQILPVIKDYEVTKLPVLTMFRDRPSAAVFSGKLLEHFESIGGELHIIDCSSMSEVRAYIAAKMGVGIGWYFTETEKTGFRNTATNGEYVSVPLEYDSPTRFYLSVKYASGVPHELIVLIKNILLDRVYDLNASII